MAQNCSRSIPMFRPKWALRDARRGCSLDDLETRNTVDGNAKSCTTMLGWLKPHLVAGLEHGFYMLLWLSHHTGNVITPTDELLFFRGWLNHQPAINNGMFTNYQLVQDFATIHSSNEHPSNRLSYSIETCSTQITRTIMNVFSLQSSTS